MRKFQEDMQKLNKEFEIQIATIRLQLQRANEIRDQEVTFSRLFPWPRNYSDIIENTVDIRMSMVKDRRNFIWYGVGILL